MMTAALQGMTGSSRLSRCVMRAGLLATLSLVSTGIARADCNEDLGKLMNKRMAEIGALNHISKDAQGRLNPTAACPLLRNLAAQEGEVTNYMTKNKDWCNLPDDLVEKMTASHAKTASIAAKACGFAVKMKQMQQQQAAQVQQQQQQQAVKLPTGPL